MAARKSTRPSKSAKVERVLLDARALRTVGPEHLLWSVAALPNADRLTMAETEPWAWRGAIVRVRPPNNVTDAQVADVKRKLVGAGAAAVRVEPKARADVPAPASEEPRPHASQREVVMRRAESSKRRAELVELLDLELAKEGL